MIAQGFAFGLGLGLVGLVVAVLVLGARLWLASRKPERVMVVEDPTPEDDARPEWMRRRVYDPYAGYTKHNNGRRAD